MLFTRLNVLLLCVFNPRYSPATLLFFRRSDQTLGEFNFSERRKQRPLNRPASSATVTWLTADARPRRQTPRLVDGWHLLLLRGNQLKSWAGMGRSSTHTWPSACGGKERRWGRTERVANHLRTEGAAKHRPLFTPCLKKMHNVSKLNTFAPSSYIQRQSLGSSSIITYSSNHSHCLVPSQWIKASNISD